MRDIFAVDLAQFLFPVDIRLIHLDNARRAAVAGRLDLADGFADNPFALLAGGILDEKAFHARFSLSASSAHSSPNSRSRKIHSVSDTEESTVANMTTLLVSTPLCPMFLAIT